MLSQVAASKSRWKKDPRKIKSAGFIYFFLLAGEMKTQLLDETEPSVVVENPAGAQRKRLKPCQAPGIAT